MAAEMEVTAVMLTYGAHKNETEEAIYSFLRQDYLHKRLLILNTHPDPIIINAGEYEKLFDVRVLNMRDEDFQTDIDRGGFHAASYYAISQVETPLLCIMDDDDICLPWHISQLVSLYEKYKKKEPDKFVSVGTGRLYLSRDCKKQISCVHDFPSWLVYLYEKPSAAVLEDIYGRSLSGPFYDEHFRENPAWERATFPEAKISCIKRDCIFGRWAGGRGDDRGFKAAIYNNRITEPFVPHWDIDYVKLVEEFERRGHENT